MQLFSESEAQQFPFDHLDPTKLIPEELVPIQYIGSFILDRWPDNFFAETEQVAFCPANLPPGVDFSNDPLLQGRLFSYLDTQLSRLGSPNFTHIPINAPRCPFANNQRDAHMQTTVASGRVSYEPSSLDPNAVREAKRGFTAFAETTEPDSHVGRIRPESFADHYSQARQFYLSQSQVEQGHLISAIVFELSKVETVEVRMRTISHLSNVDAAMAERVAKGLGMSDMPARAKPCAPVLDLPPSKALRLIDKYPPTLKGRCVGILVADGSNGANIAAIKKAVEAEGARVKIVAPAVTVKLKDGSQLAADGQLAGTPSIFFDAVASILAPDQAQSLAKDSDARDWFADAFRHLKAIAACKGTQIILDAISIDRDDWIVAPEDVATFLDKAKSRNWSREKSVQPKAP